jgi:glycosyltransferase involved in cell wall biosynthesis
LDAAGGKKYGLPEYVSGNLVERVRAYALKAPAVAHKNKHSVIHAHDWLTYPAGIAAKEASGKPLVVHVHATEFDRSGSDNVNKEIFDIKREGLRRADAIVTVSNRTRDTVIKKYEIPAEKIRTIYNGVEFQKSAGNAPELIAQIKKRGGKIVLYAGRITLQKGPDYFVSLAKKILDYEPDAFFVVSGSGDMEDYMVREVSKLGIAKNFIFCGFLRGQELATIYRESDIYVMPSVSEPFGILPLECMISDTPVLVSKESGVSEVVSCALKSHFWDIDDMADKVVSVLRHRKLQNHLSVNGRTEAKEIHWKKAAQSLISLYNSFDDAFGLLLLPGSPAPAGAQVPHF